MPVPVPVTPTRTAPDDLTWPEITTDEGPAVTPATWPELTGEMTPATAALAIVKLHAELAAADLAVYQAQTVDALANDKPLPKVEHQPTEGADADFFEQIHSSLAKFEMASKLTSSVLEPGAARKEGSVRRPPTLPAEPHSPQRPTLPRASSELGVSPGAPLSRRQPATSQRWNRPECTPQLPRASSELGVSPGAPLSRRQTATSQRWNRPERTPQLRAASAEAPAVSHTKVSPQGRPGFVVGVEDDPSPTRPTTAIERLEERFGLTGAVSGATPRESRAGSLERPGFVVGVESGWPVASAPAAPQDDLITRMQASMAKVEQAAQISNRSGRLHSREALGGRSKIRPASPGPGGRTPREDPATPPTKSKPPPRSRRDHSNLAPSASSSASSSERAPSASSSAQPSEWEAQPPSLANGAPAQEQGSPLIKQRV